MTTRTQVFPTLAARDGDAAIAFYRAAFDATLLWHLDGGGEIVAGLAIEGAQFFLAQESPPAWHSVAALPGLHNRQN